MDNTEKKKLNLDIYSWIHYSKHDSCAVKRMSEKSRLEKLLEEVEAELETKDAEEENEWKT